LITSRASKALKASECAEHSYTVVSGNGVPQMHMHIIPRYENTQKEIWSPTEGAKWNGEHYGYAEKIKKLCDIIRKYMVSE
ncbi:HIT family protein, partial [Bacillus tropicus]|nr:HIT family protein [Bacillus tropicus]